MDDVDDILLPPPPTSPPPLSDDESDLPPPPHSNAAFVPVPPPRIKDSANNSLSRSSSSSSGGSDSVGNDSSCSATNTPTTTTTTTPVRRRALTTSAAKPRSPSIATPPTPTPAPLQQHHVPPHAPVLLPNAHEAAAAALARATRQGVFLPRLHISTDSPASASASTAASASSPPLSLALVPTKVDRSFRRSISGELGKFGPANVRLNAKAEQLAAEVGAATSPQRPDEQHQQQQQQQPLQCPGNGVVPAIRVAPPIPPRVKTIRIQPDPSSEEQRVHNLRCAIEEIYGAERTYLRDITFLFEIESIDEMNAMLRNVDVILQLAKQMLSDLELAKLNSEFTEGDSISMLTKSIARVFSQMAPYLKAYGSYVTDHTKLLEILKKLQHNHQYLDFCKAVKAAVVSNKETVSKDPNELPYAPPMYDLESLLIKPVQRVCQYPLLLKAVTSRLPDGNEDRTTLEGVARSMEKIAAAVNEYKHQHEQQDSVVDIQLRLIEVPEEFTIVSANRLFLMQGSVTLTVGDKSREVRMVLFNDAILFAKPIAKWFSNSAESLAFRGFLDLGGDILLNATETRRHFSFSIIDMGDIKNRCIYMVTTSSAAEKEKWVKAISEALFALRHGEQEILQSGENIHFPASPRSRRAVQYRAPPIPNTVILSPLSSPREEHVPSVRVSTYDHFAEIDQEAAQFELRNQQLEAEALARVQKEIEALTNRLASRQLYRGKLEADVNALLQEQRELTSAIAALKTKHGEAVDPTLRKMHFFDVSFFG